MSDILAFQPGVSLDQGKYLLRSAVKPGRWSLTLHGIRAKDLAAVIIKTPIAQYRDSRFQTAWIRRTFQALGDLNHPSRARFLDWFEHEGRPFLVMQKVKGQSLEQQLQQGPLSEAVALQLIRQVAAGLAGVHSQGLIHRDIQPKNIIFRQGVGIPTLVDWGLQSVKTPMGHLAADNFTPFSAPEQLQGGDILKHRLDIYSLAATLYATVTGQAPLSAAKRHHKVPNPSPAALAGLIPPRQHQPRLSPDIEQAILQGMTLDPQQRPATLENWLNLFPLSQSLSATATNSAQKAQQSPGGGPFNQPVIEQNPGQIWATQPPPSQVSARQSPKTYPPAFSQTQPSEAISGTAQPSQQRSRSGAAKPGTAKPENSRTPKPTTPRVTTPSPALPQRPSSPKPHNSSATNPPGTNYVLGDRKTGVTPPQNNTPPPSEQPRETSPKLGTVKVQNSSRMKGSRTTGSPSQVTPSPKTMVGAAQSSTRKATIAPPHPLKRLASILILTGSIGLAGGLLLRVVTPGSVAGFSGLGRAQNFPEVDWPGQTEMDDLPEDIPQPEYSSDSWSDDGWDDAEDAWGETEEELPEVIFDSNQDDEPLDIPSEQINESERSPYYQTEEDYNEALNQPDDEGYSEEYYPGEQTDTNTNESYSDYPTGGEAYEAESSDYVDNYPAEAEQYPAETYEAEIAPEPSNEAESWGEDPWVEEPWIEEESAWQDPPPITANDFPPPELPPAYEEPIPQSAIPLPEDGNIL